MSFTEINVTADGGVTTLTLNRPQALNAITPIMLKEAKQAVDVAGADTNIRAIVVTGEGRAVRRGGPQGAERCQT